MNTLERFYLFDNFQDNGPENAYVTFKGPFWGIETAAGLFVRLSKENNNEYSYRKPHSYISGELVESITYKNKINEGEKNG